jgi:hypothetical protein
MMTDEGYNDPGWGDPNRLHPDGAPGQAEQQMRMLLGDATYERMKKNTQEYQALSFASTKAHTSETLAKAGMWSALGFLLVAGTLLGVAWSIWAWVS